MLLPEWYPQSGVQITWPDSQTDWAPILDEVIPCYAAVAREILKHEKLLVVCRNEALARRQSGCFDNPCALFFQTPINDTWARDYAPLSVLEDGRLVLLDFQFNGWGLKYPACHDNQITARLFASGTVFSPAVTCRDLRPLVLEGGGIETDGQGTILTTSCCLLSGNRNEFSSKAQAKQSLAAALGAKRFLWLDHGHLIGDDTDGHIDTLARFCNDRTIAYVRCTDRTDPHYSDLCLMEQQIQSFTRSDGQPYDLIPLPMPEKVEYNGEQLPATYANFLIINGAVLLPFYNCPQDLVARDALQCAFPDREITGIDCRPLVKQHGSLHCITMQYPEGGL
ncbi:putative agmatine deiminase [Bacteroidales bacterium Barb6]|nr:putative agmatine deiminase [Bacteroidales bacterium Barb6]